jgi:hypothetical protein
MASAPNGHRTWSKLFRIVAGAAVGAVPAAPALLVAAGPADAAGRICGERATIVRSLEQRHHERPRALGLSADGGVVEVLVSPKGGWTILLTYPDRPTCIIAIGEAWQALAVVGERA